MKSEDVINNIVSAVAIFFAASWCLTNKEAFNLILPAKPHEPGKSFDNVLDPVLPGGVTREPHFTTSGVPSCQGADPMGPGVQNDRMARWERANPPKIITTNGDKP